MSKEGRREGGGGKSHCAALSNGCPCRVVLYTAIYLAHKSRYVRNTLLLYTSCSFPLILVSILCDTCTVCVFVRSAKSSKAGKAPTATGGPSVDVVDEEEEGDEEEEEEEEGGSEEGESGTTSLTATDVKGALMKKGLLPKGARRGGQKGKKPS